MFVRDPLHVMVFEGVDGGTEIWAHHERNAYDPLTAYAHYRGKGYDADRGVKEAREMLGITH